MPPTHESDCSTLGQRSLAGSHLVYDVRNRDTPTGGHMTGDLILTFHVYVVNVALLSAQQHLHPPPLFLEYVWIFLLLLFFCSLRMCIISRIALVPHGRGLDVKRP